MVANCREKTATSLSLIRPERPGILMSRAMAFLSFDSMATGTKPICRSLPATVATLSASSVPLTSFPCGSRTL